MGSKGERTMFGFTIGFWDYMTFAALAVIAFAVVLFLFIILGLPGRIAIARKHPEADAVQLMGWVGFVAIVPWIQALIWAFKPTDVVDIRRFPREERIATEQEIARLSGKDPKGGIAEPDEKTTAAAPGKKDGEEI
jgi:CBS domain containing-hemolysin-like protein